MKVMKVNEIPNTSIAKYAIKGMMSEKSDKFIERLALILTKNRNLLNLLVCGVPVGTNIVNEDIIINDINNAKSIESSTINDNFEIIINVVRTQKRYFRTQEEADSSDYWGGNSRYSEENPICKEVEYTCAVNMMPEYKDAIEIEYL